ncbi:hypothetical protein Tco_0477580 [Tanacetum coccineum]
MSFASSAVTYTSVYTDSEPGRVLWRADEEVSNGSSPRVIVLGYDGLSIQPVAPPSPDYIPDPEDPQTPPVTQDHDYVPEPIYPEYIPLEDVHVFPVEEQPLPPVVSPTAESPGYVVESDPKEDPEDDSSRDDADDKDEDEEEEEEEEWEEHLALADSAVVVPTVELVSPPEGTKPVIPPPSTDITTTGARINGRPCEAPGMRYEEGSSARSYRRRGKIMVCQARGWREARRQGISEVGYGIRDTWVDPAEAVPEVAPMTVGEVNTRVTELAELHERDTHDMYALLEDAQDVRTRISQRVAMDSQRVDLLIGDMMTLQETIQGHQTQLQLQGTLIQTQHQAELLALRRQQRARQPGPDARILDHQDASGDADSHI